MNQNFKKNKKMIEDSKKFNDKIDNFIRKTEYEMSLPILKSK